MRNLGIVAIAAALAGCGSVNHQTASGKVEVTISATPEAVKASIVNAMVNQRYRISKDTAYEIAFDKPSENLLAVAFLGSKYDGTPNTRVSYFLAPTPPTVRVVADFAIITNPGSSFERRTDLNRSEDTAQVQALLEGVKAEVEHRAVAPAPPASRPKKSGT